MDTSYDNFKYLTGRLLQSADHLALEPLFKPQSDADIAHIFRNHLTDPIGITSPNEIALRRHMDNWLNESSLIYLSWLSGYSSDPAGTDQGNRIFAILGHTALRPYYESYYKQALPCLFCLHFEDDKIERQNSPGAFEAFANLFERFRNDAELACFLEFLDGYCYGKAPAIVTIDSVIRAFENPDRIVEATFRPASQLTPLDSGIVGLLHFATFCTSLHAFLEKCKDLPLLQSAFWFFYAYWFREYKKDVKNLSIQAIQNAAMNTKDSGSQALASESQDRLNIIMSALTGNAYASVLIERFPAPDIGIASFDLNEKAIAKPSLASRFAAYNIPRTN
jgi:hypothetical protein